MKLKIRFESKYMIRLGIFAGVLFIIVSILISNLVCFSANGEFCGLNVLYAYRDGNFLTTFLIFLVAFIGLVASCKAYFFEFDKGFGFTTEKKMDGYSNWCDKKEMTKELSPVLANAKSAEHGGIPLINDGKTLWVDDGEYHNLIIGSTGSGKTQCIIFPLVQVLAKHNESMVITDPKGEIYEQTSQMLRKRGYNIVLLNFRSPQQGNSWNPLALPYHLWKSGNYEKAIELLDDLALNILYDDSNKNADPFWEKTSAGYFAGLALGLFEDATEEQININSINMMTTVGEEKTGGSTYIKEYFNTKDPNGAAYTNASSTLLSPSETKGSILAVFKEKIKLFATRPNLSEMLSYSDFDLADIGKKKSAVFIVIQDEKKTYHPLATIMIKQIYETLIDVAFQNGGALPVRTNFLLDEFANMPPLKDVTTMITAARSRHVRFTMIIQNFAQLNEIYGEQTAETIKGNCGNMVYLISTELKALEEISKMCGEVKSKKDDKTSSTPLVTVSDLQKMKMFEVIIRRLRKAPFKTYLTPNFKMDWGYSYPKIDLFKTPEREHHEVQIFDVREYVKAKKKEKMDNLLGDSSSGGALPFFGGNGNPFMDKPGGSNPFMGGNDMFNSPFMPSSPSPINNNSKNDNYSDIDVDAIVRKIDEQIARLEEEEKMEKEKNGNDVDIELSIPKEKNDDLEDFINDKKLREENNNLVEEMFVSSTKPIEEDFEDLNDIIEKSDINMVNIEESVNSDKNNVNDYQTVNMNKDDYFDDFFDE